MHFTNGPKTKKPEVYPEKGLFIIFLIKYNIAKNK